MGRQEQVDRRDREGKVLQAMNILKKFFRAIANLFSTPEGRQRIEKALSATYELVQVAMPIVQLVAALTPTRADDEIVALIYKYALPVAIPREPLTDAEKGAVLKTAAVTILRNQLHSPPADSILDTAVQMAFLAFKNAEEPEA